MYILALDPGISNCSMAIFNDRKLVSVDILYNDYKRSKSLCSKNNKIYKMKRMSELLIDYIKNHKYKFTTLLSEFTLHLNSAQQSSISRMSYIVGSITHLFENVELYTPAPLKSLNTWKKFSKKEENHEYFLKRLTKKEHSIIIKGTEKIKEADRHNVLDAVSIGLYRLRGEM